MNNCNEKWNFPDNRYGADLGFNVGDMDIFQRDPVSHFAREICQNSIDAKSSDTNEPVRVDFKLFEINKSDIPGYVDLRNEAHLCRQYVDGSAKTADKEIAKCIVNSLGDESGFTIPCMRVSDFNTTGLYGVKNNQEGKPFYELTRGSGSSDKSGTSAGSKGIGKFAAFVISKTRTVFYSTRAKDPRTGDIEEGYIGISKLRSRPIGNDSSLKTQSTGYYAVDERNLPIQYELQLDKSFRRGCEQYGTDIYIIGFNEENWENKIIRNVLDSFMAAIVRGTLEVNVGSQLINKDTVDDIIFEIKKQSHLSLDDKSIISQYELLTSNDETVHRKTVKIANCDTEIAVKTFLSSEANYATRKCVRIRWPYMKIDVYRGKTALAPYSAMCMIGNNELNRKLRAIENAQHTDWQIERVRDDINKYREIKAIRKELNNAIDDFIAEVLKSSNRESMDFEGAGEYLPDEDEGMVESDEMIDSDETKPVVTPPTRRQPRIHGGKNSATGDEDTQHGSGGDDGDDEGGTGSGGGGDSPSPSPGPNPEPNPDPNKIKIGGGNEPVLKSVLTNKTKFKCFRSSFDSDFIVSFSAVDTEADCQVILSAIGDSNDSERIIIKSAECNGRELEIDNGTIVHLPIVDGNTYKIKCDIERKGIFASKVELYAYKK